MNILCLIDSLGSGGAQRQLVGLSYLLQQKGHATHVVWYHNDNFYQNFLEKKKIKFENIYAVGKFSKLYKVALCIKRNKPDIVIAYLDGPTVITCLLKIFGIHYKLIVSERNITISNSWKERLKFFMYRWADAIVPNSYSQENFIKCHYPYLSSKLYTITNFTDTNYFSLKSQFIIAKQNPIKLLVVGRIVEQKNVHLFIQAIKIIVDKGFNIFVEWYGKAYNENYYMSCLNEVKRNSLSNIFSFHEESQNIKDVYHDSDVFCLPSIYEGFPNVICEAMSCGLPILCSDICDNSRIIENGRNGYLFNPFSPIDIANKIEIFLLLDDISKKNMGKLSRKLAIERFSKEQFVNKYNNLIYRI